MKMRKFIIEIHPDGTLTCCEYEDPVEAIRAANDRSWLAGYKQALVHCNEQVNVLKATNIVVGSVYQGATYVRDRVAEMYRKYCDDAVGGPQT